VKPVSLWDAFVLFGSFISTQESKKKANSILGQTLTALVRFTLPGLGYSTPQGRKLTRSEVAAAQEFMKGLPVNCLSKLTDAQEQVFDQFQVAPASRYTYRCRLHTFLTWAESQLWSPRSSKKLVQNLSPCKKHGYGNTKGKCVTTRRLLSPYALKSTEISKSLQSELDEFVRFLSAEYYPGRKCQPLRPRTVKRYVERILTTLGWLYRFQKVPLEKVNFDSLIPKVPLRHCDDPAKAIREAEMVAEEIDNWICCYLEFLTQERQYQSNNSLIQVLIAIHALVRFQYARETTDSQYHDIPAMRVLREHLRSLEKKSLQDKPVADQQLKWLDLPDVWQRVVTPLRYECAYRNVAGGLRTITAVSRSFQIFLIWGMLTFRPPRRQQEFRDLKFSLSCPVKRPEGLTEGQFIHPLPPERNQDKYFGYLYKDIDGKWYEDKTPESYKTGKTYHHQRLEVINQQFPDGKCFYDYLEAYLYGYYRDADGNWQSASQVVTAPVGNSQWYGLRSAFNPIDNHVFVKPTTGIPHHTGSFYRLVQNSAHRLTGQMVTPHLLRDIYATWFLDQGYTEDRIRSLAYAMGHSIEVLRKIYDRRRPQQKVRPIQEVVTDLLAKYIS
jgi:hypothetical protein